MPEPPKPIKPCVVLLNGYPAVGKLTLARTLLTRLPPNSTRLIDNHLWLDPAFAIHPNRHIPQFFELCKSLRNVLFSALKNQSADTTVIMTDVLFNPMDNLGSGQDGDGEMGFKDKELRRWLGGFSGGLGEYVDVARARGCPFVLVCLGCEGGENGRRLEGRDVGGKGKLRNPGRLEEMRRGLKMLDGNSEGSRKLVEGVEFYCFELDTTELDVDGSVDAVLGVLRTI